VSRRLIARIRPLEPWAGERPDEAEHNDAPPAPLRGFRLESEASEVVLTDGVATVGTLRLARAERLLAGRRIARAALLGPLVALPNDVLGTGVVDAAYRAVLDRLIFTAPAPDIISLRLLDGQDAHVDVLWRLALELDVEALIGEERDALRIDLIRDGRRARLAAALARWPLRIVDVWRMTYSLVGRRSVRVAEDELLVLARDLRRGVAEVRSPVPVEFEEARLEEVKHRPRRFGLGLSMQFIDETSRRHFVGRVGNRVVYRMACNISPRILERLVAPELLAALSPPFALVSDCRTDSDFRGRAIYPVALQWLSRWAANNGLLTLVLLIRESNQASLRGAAKAGFVRLGPAVSERSRTELV
jgi:hypothetical protein